MNTPNQLSTYEHIFPTEFRLVLRAIRKGVDAGVNIDTFLQSSIPQDQREEITSVLTEYKNLDIEDAFVSGETVLIHLMASDSINGARDRQCTLELFLVRPCGLYDGSPRTNEWAITGYSSGWITPQTA